MGSKSTKLFKSSNHSSSKVQKDENDFREHKNDNNPQQLQPEKPANTNPTSPFVYYRRGSMYVDEDGDTAHEFYVEVTDGSKATLKQINKNNLTPQGDVLLEVPCIRNDYPIVLLDQNSKVKE